MKKTISLLIALILATAAIPGALATMPEAADTVFENGIIYTVDDADSTAEALAVKDGKIIFVGTNEEAAAYKGEGTETIDLQGRLMMPGFTDSHIHTVSMDFFDFSLLGINDVDEALAVIEAYVKENPDKEVYNGIGYSVGMFTGDELDKGPRKERLDAICADKPMFIYSFDFHTGWVNSKYYEVHGITKDTQSPPGGAIEKDDATGELWGTLKDSASALGGDMVYDPQLLDFALRDFQATLNSYGYTGIMTLPGYGNFAIPLEGYGKLEEAGELTIRVTGASAVMSWRYEEDIEKAIALNSKYTSDMLKMPSTKFFADGVLDGRGAYLLEPYSDNAANYGEPGWEPDALADAYTKVNEAGLQAHTHAIGDGAARQVLDALEYAKAHAPEGDYRNAITHLQLVAQEDIPRFAALDVVGVPQTYWHYKAPQY